MKLRVILVVVAVALLTLGCKGDRRRGSSGSRGGDPSGSTPRPGSGTPICSNTCERAENGICEDGAIGSMSSACERGTDCSDCGTRYDSTSSGDGEGDGPAPTTRDASTSCECDYYEWECEDCHCDPDCEDRGGSTHDAGGGTAGFGDECECFDTGEGFCGSSSCGGDLECFAAGGYGICTTPCSSFDVGLYEVCPSGGQCQELALEESWYLCVPS